MIANQTFLKKSKDRQRSTMSHYLHSLSNSEKLEEKDIRSLLTGYGAKLDLSIEMAVVTKHVITTFLNYVNIRIHCVNEVENNQMRPLEKIYENDIR